MELPWVWIFVVLDCAAGGYAAPVVSGEVGRPPPRGRGPWLRAAAALGAEVCRCPGSARPKSEADDERN